ncbi:helix-turn-helix domain-containing protein [Microbacterium terrisoli]|uniref:helix-turn-helix domain-containing protein n=1 Tax=Microbacterium terrisoli TaxID=3242192 RepID=UPI00280491C5|nr:helix-turn-helix transcriptional regulator [Microbacterium protaetiae]
MNATQVAADLRRNREQHGCSQQELADAMNAAGFSHWSQATVWAVETGNRNLLYIEGITLSSILPGFGINSDRIGRNIIRDAQTLEKVRELIETSSSYDLA